MGVMIWEVATDADLIQIVRPVAADLFALDVQISAEILKRRGSLAGLDNHPVASAVANERRAMVGTELRKTIAPNAGWVLVEDNLASGAYEWLVGDYAVRLSKTTPESRQKEAAAKVFQGTQGALFSMAPVSGSKRETALIRLMGNPLAEASIDAIWAEKKGASAIPLRAIAAGETERFRGTATPPKPSVTLPGRVRRADESS